MIKRSRENYYSEEHNGGTFRWLVSYADYITVLFMVFAAMVVFNNVEGEQEKNAIDNQSQSAFSDQPETSLTDVEDKEKQEQMSKEIEELENIEQTLQDYIKSAGLEDKMFASIKPKGIEITFRDAVLFDSARADIKPIGENVLRDVIPFLMETNNKILIQGHTDNRPIYSIKYRDNFELSVDRSLSVLYYLKNNGISADRLSSEGKGEYDTIADNGTEDGRTQNRRVNIIILRDNVSDMLN